MINASFKWSGDLEGDLQVIIIPAWIIQPTAKGPFHHWNEPFGYLKTDQARGAKTP
ncbi:hypothetical protein KRZ98_14455 [Sphingobium sp. AS12]|uniref:hypothetical protein n=1 Tax=Sphingobium sp. AS12 TaxID=2849495 RepID=UPI001C316368|nr:hypothetical protein [Sphingobium sp. AS12]MBV2149470.1 hypothetical protein [Sphingobium sp. AS12]